MRAWFTEDELRAAAGPRSFARGAGYRSAVTDIRLAADHARATVRGSDDYEVRLRTADDGVLSGECTCPFGVDGNFCKHCVAVGLVLLSTVDAVEPALAPGDTGVRGYLESLPHDELIDLLCWLADEEPDVRQALARRAGAGRGSKAGRLAAWVEETLRVPAPLGYHDIRDYRDTVAEIRNAIDELVEQGLAGEVAPIARTVVELLLRAMTRADDPDGLIAAAAADAVACYARVCATASPDPTELAEWLYRIQLTGGEVTGAMLETLLDEFAEVLGDAGLDVYRARLEEVHLLPGDDGRQLALRGMRLRLARFCRDADAVVAIYSARLPAVDGYLSIAVELSDLGHTSDAVDWAERGLADNPGAPALVDFLGGVYAKLGRADDTVLLYESELRARPSRQRFVKLKESAAALGQWSRRRDAALDVLRGEAERTETGDDLAAALLLEDQVDQAWAVVERYRCHDHVWLAVARRRSEEHPADVLSGYRAAINRRVRQTGRQSYRAAAELMRELAVAAESCGKTKEFRDYLHLLRHNHKRKPALLDELTKAGF